MTHNHETCNLQPGTWSLAQCATPCYIYSADTIRSQYRKLAESFPGFKVCYSLKANPNPAIGRLLSELGAGAEISSQAELQSALSAGFRPEDVIFVGPAKSEDDILLAVQKSIYAIVAESVEELRQIEAACRSAEKTQLVLLRINTLEQPQAREVMVGKPSKFGFDEETVVEQLRGLKLKYARIGGIQVYSASQILDPTILSSHFEYVLRLARRLSSELVKPGTVPDCAGCSDGRRGLSQGFPSIDFGGGFGVPYAEDETELDLAPVAETVRCLRAEHRDFLAGSRLLLESGRYIVAQSGVFLTRVVRVKGSRGKTFVITDAGMNAFSRPVFMRIQHPIRLVNKLAEPVAGRYEVCGPICTPLDSLGADAPLPKPEPGDVVGVFNAGAYGYTMSLKDFMSLPHPTEYLADRGRLIPVQRGT